MVRLLHGYIAKMATVHAVKVSLSVTKHVGLVVQRSGVQILVVLV